MRTLQFTLALALTTLLFSLTTSAAQTGKPPRLEIGAAAPAFNLPAADGKSYQLSDFAEAKALVVVFTCNHCPTAQAYEDRIKALAADYKDKSVAIVAISPNDDLAVRIDELGYTEYNDSLAEMTLRAKEANFNFPYLYDGENQKVSWAFGALVTPHIFVFDADRKLRFNGRIDDNENPALVKSHDARDAIDAVLADKKPAAETTKVFGCSVKWSDKRSIVAQRLAEWDQEPATLEKIDAAQAAALAANNDSDKYRLINVWATWCGPCTDEFDALVDIHRQFRKRPFEVVTITMDLPDKFDQAHKFLNSKHASMKNYLFNSTDRFALIEALDGKHWDGPIPYTLLVAPGGEVLLRQEGRFESMQIKKAIVKAAGRTYHD